MIRQAYSSGKIQVSSQAKPLGNSMMIEVGRGGPVGRSRVGSDDDATRPRRQDRAEPHDGATTLLSKRKLRRILVEPASLKP
jgi:hypothetical protein